MVNKRSKYDPIVHGQARAEFLDRLAGYTISRNFSKDEEKRREKLIKEIKEGKLIVNR
jgi:hypothetical protein